MLDYTVTGRGGGPEMVGLVDGIVAWCDVLQGRRTMHEGLDALASGLGAEAIALSKASRKNEAPMRSICVDCDQTKSVRQRLERGYADQLLGPYLRSARSGTVWFAAMSMPGDAAPLADFHGRRGLRDMVTIVLGTEEKAIYLLELHFAQTLSAEATAMFNALAQSLQRTWMNRASGLFSEALLNKPGPSPMDGPETELLSPDNPARLSRAEFRVCLLLKGGLSSKRVQSELSISSSTLRTHLRQIYAKTNCSNQAELLYQLLAAPGQARALPAARHAV